MRWCVVASVLALVGCGGKKAAAIIAPARPEVFCTRTLGAAECFADPQHLPDHPAGMADTPASAPKIKSPWWSFDQDEF
jgi:hypothetical protein